jgi:hypothetical protein
MNRKLRRRIVTAACVFMITLLINPGLALAQEEAGLEEWQENEIRPILDRLYAAIDGDTPSEKPLEIVTMDFLKGAEGVIYAPFTMTMDPSKFSQPEFVMYMYATPHVEPPAAAEDAPESAEDTLRVTIFEDLFFVNVSESTSAEGLIEIDRAFQAPGGTYDFYILVRDSLGPEGDLDDLEDSMVMVFKEEVEVPNFWSEEFQTSTLMKAVSMDLIEAPLAPDEQRANPYTIGTTKITPKRHGNYGKDEELTLLFYVYNPQLADEMKPDVLVEFDFYRVGPLGESFFNKTAPQAFNGETLPADFPVSAGLPSGQSVPLASFPTGDFRLEIKITDNVAEQMLTREMRFNVSE